MAERGDRPRELGCGFRIEVAKARSPLWPWFVQQVRAFPNYSVRCEDGVEVHVVDRLSFDQAVKLWELTGEWRGIAIFKDGQPISVRRFRQLAWRDEWNKRAPRDGLDHPFPRVDVCPRCSGFYRKTDKACRACGFPVAPIDAEVVDDG